MADILFITEALLAWAFLTIIQIPLRMKEHRIIGSAVFVLKVILIPLVALLFVAADWVTGYAYAGITCAFYVALIADVMASAVEFAVRMIRARNDDKEKRHAFDHRVGTPVSLVICVAVLAFGTVTAGTVGMATHEWQADGLTDTHTFAFASDIHAGSDQSMDVLRKFCGQVNSSGAEFLILGGDITDEYTTYDRMLETYGILSTVSIPVYLVMGNHDRQLYSHLAGGRTYTDAQLLDAIDAAGITLLRDEFVLVDGDLVLLGREDVSAGDARKAWADLSNPYPGKTLIVADHQPYDKDQLKVEVSALQLSGHTHAGQLWPLQTIYNLLGYPAYGEFDYPGTRLYVSPGLNGWSPPMRTEVHCGWELITLHP